MNRTTAILTVAAVTVVIGLGILAHYSPEFKETGTVAGIVVLGLMALTGLFGALLAPLLDVWTTDTHTGTGIDMAVETPGGRPLASCSGGMR